VIDEPAASALWRRREHPGVIAVQFPMKKTLGLTRMAVLGTLATAILLIGCAAQKDARQPGKAPDPVYETAEQIKAMPPCKARVVQRAPCFVYLKTTDGRGFYIGSPGSKADVGRFLGFLKDGERYNLPEAYLTYEKNRQLAEP
jgi:hypothetical protein